MNKISPFKAFFLLIATSFWCISYLGHSAETPRSCQEQFYRRLQVLEAPYDFTCVKKEKAPTCFYIKGNNQDDGVWVPSDYFINHHQDAQYRARLASFFTPVPASDGQSGADYILNLSSKEDDKKYLKKTKRWALIHYFECLSKRNHEDQESIDRLRKKIQVLKENSMEDMGVVLREEQENLMVTLENLYKEGEFKKRPLMLRTFMSPQLKLGQSQYKFSDEEKNHLLEVYFNEFYQNSGGVKDQVLTFIEEEKKREAEKGLIPHENFIFHKKKTGLPHSIIRTMDGHFLIVANTVLERGSFKTVRLVYDIELKELFVKLSFVDEEKLSQEHDLLLEMLRGNELQNREGAILNVYYAQKYIGKASERKKERLNGEKRAKIFLISDYYNFNGKTYLDSDDIQVKDLFKLAQDMSKALSLIHEKEILHLDIKHSNILVLKDKEGRIRKNTLGDFGLGRFLNEKRSHQVCGTGFYIDPLFYHGVNLDEKSDVWSLGAVLFEIIFQEKFLNKLHSFLASLNSGIVTKNKSSFIQMDLRSYAIQGNSDVVEKFYGELFLKRESSSTRFGNIQEIGQLSLFVQYLFDHVLTLDGQKRVSAGEFHKFVSNLDLVAY